ncbi:MAG: arginine--tRNA ligase [Acidimicrobiales bacterium]
MAHPLRLLSERFQAAMTSAFGDEGARAGAVLRRSGPGRFGDYQANGAMALAKRLGKPAREVATAIVERLDLADAATVEVAGPGFLNITLTAGVLAGAASEMAADPRLGVTPAQQPETVVVDYSGPNLAKEMHVGHLRSTVIGDAIVRVLSVLGHRVIPQNHVGDWGTQFGMLVEHLGGKGGAERSIGDLDQFYREASARFTSDAAFADRARRRVVALQNGDPETLATWRALVAESARHAREAYDRLGVTLTDADIRGESAYNPMLATVAADLEAAGVARIDAGALCAFPPGFANREGEPLPLIVRKADGGFGYAATDLAALRHRVAELGADRLAYVVDARQSQHFAMMFAVARAAGWLTEGVRAEHVAFGTVLGPDGKPLKTRSGDNVRLIKLLDEAVERAGAVVEEKSPDLDPAARAAVARAVGIGAVKYADLANDRPRDYTFDFDRMLAMDGNTAPYLQYANARIRSILGKAGEARPGPVALTHPAERALVLELCELAPAVEATAEWLQPHRLCTYLFSLATRFTAFYESCPVLAAPDDRTQASRLALTALAGRTLAFGLGLLGIEAPERM